MVYGPHEYARKVRDAGGVGFPLAWAAPFDSWVVAVSSCLYALESFSTKRAPTSKGFQYLRSGSGTHHSRWSVSPVRYQRTPRKRVFQAVTILREKTPPICRGHFSAT